MFMTECGIHLQPNCFCKNHINSEPHQTWLNTSFFLGGFQHITFSPSHHADYPLMASFISSSSSVWSSDVFSQDSDLNCLIYSAYIHLIKFLIQCQDFKYPQYLATTKCLSPPQTSLPSCTFSVNDTETQMSIKLTTCMTDMNLKIKNLTQTFNVIIEFSFYFMVYTHSISRILSKNIIFRKHSSLLLLFPG